MNRNASRLPWLAMAVVVIVSTFSFAPVFAADAPAVAPPAPARRTRPPQLQRIARGVLVKIDGHKLTVKPDADFAANGNPDDPASLINLELNDDSVIRGSVTTLDELRAGEMRVDVLTYADTRVRKGWLEVTGTWTSLSGTVVRVDGDKLVVKPSPRPGAAASEPAPAEVTVTADDATEIFAPRIGGNDPQALLSALNAKSKLTDIAPGTRVTVQPASGTARSIRGIMDMGEMRQRFAGTRRPVPLPISNVVKVEGNTIVAKTFENGEQKEVKLAVDESSATIIVDHEPGKLADIRPGMSVTGREMGNPPKLTITAVSTTLDSNSMQGEAESVESNGDVAVRILRKDQRFETVLVATDASTRFVFTGERPRPGGVSGSAERKLADVKAGARVSVFVIPETGVAKKLIVSPGFQD